MFSVTATAIMISSLESGHFYTQTLVSLVMSNILSMSLGDKLCFHVLVDVTGCMTGVSQLGGILPMGVSLNTVSQR